MTLKMNTVVAFQGVPDRVFQIGDNWRGGGGNKKCMNWLKAQKAKLRPQLFLL